ncbi:MAG: hypothetical protein ABIN20_07865, partial [candidate division WOR-3 bacterium]
MENFYKTNGYLDFRIIDYKITKRDEKDILYVYIYEGERKIIKEISLLPDSFNYLLKFLKKKMPFYYSEDILSQFEEKLYTYFTNNGFIFFNYERIEEKKADTLKILYNLKPGKKIKIKEIKVLGLSQKTRKKIALD